MPTSPPAATEPGVRDVIWGGDGSSTVKIGPVVEPWPCSSVTIMAILPRGRSGTRTTRASGAYERTVAGGGANGTVALIRDRTPLVVTLLPGAPARGSKAGAAGARPLPSGGGRP